MILMMIGFNGEGLRGFIFQGGLHADGLKYLKLFINFFEFNLNFFLFIYFFSEHARTLLAPS
jgi:hypothetical protein